MGDVKDGSLSRRAMARLTIWAAVGASWLPALLLGCKRKATPPCYAALPRPNGTGSDPRWRQWAELGRIFRQMGTLAQGAATDHDAADPVFRKLQQEMDELLEQMEASPELRALCVERSRHIFHNELGALVTCYEYVAPIHPEVGKDVFTRAKELERLVAEGKLTDNTARKAARYLAIDAEYATGSCKVARRVGNEKPWDDATIERIHREYDEQQLQPAAEAALAGNRAVELATDRLGMLAGPPTEPRDSAKGAEST